MTFLLPAISIVLLTCLLIIAMYLRAGCRERMHHLTVDFSHDEDSWHVSVYAAKCGPFLYVFARVFPAEPLQFIPVLTCTAKKNNKKLLCLPNFWTHHYGLSLCPVKKNDCLTLETDLVFKDLLMARSFTKSLFRMGVDSADITVGHNKVSVKLKL